MALSILRLMGLMRSKIVPHTLKMPFSPKMNFSKKLYCGLLWFILNVSKSKRCLFQHKIAFEVYSLRNAYSRIFGHKSSVVLNDI